MPYYITVEDFFLSLFLKQGRSTVPADRQLGKALYALPAQAEWEAATGLYLLQFRSDICLETASDPIDRGLCSKTASTPERDLQVFASFCLFLMTSSPGLIFSSYSESLRKC